MLDKVTIHVSVKEVFAQHLVESFQKNRCTTYNGKRTRVTDVKLLKSQGVIKVVLEEQKVRMV